MSDPTNFIDPENIDQWLVEADGDIDDIDNALGLNSGGVVMLLRDLVRRVKELEKKVAAGPDPRSLPGYKDGR